MQNASVDAIILKDRGLNNPKPVNNQKKEVLKVASTKEMAEAHLRNVDSQIKQLVQQKTNIDEEIVRLTAYMEEGVTELNNSVNVTDGSVSESV